jgi:dTDP-4-amino-4,6-dideoxygalactose transaminase
MTTTWPTWPQAHDTAALLRQLSAVLRGNVWTPRAAGAEPCVTERVEAEWAQRCGVSHAFLVSSGSAALELALRAAGVGPGDDVIVPALGWYATAAAALRLGCRLVFADIDIETSCVSAASVAERLTDRTAAILVVHLHCAVSDLTSLTAVATRAGVPLIEDCAQAHGAEWAGKPVGGHGRLGCFSFNQEKLLPAGEGGAVVTSDAILAAKVHALRTDGYRDRAAGRGGWVPDGHTLGGNACPSEFQAAVLADQLGRFDALQELRRVNAEKLESALGDLPWVRPLRPGRETTARSWYEFGLVLDLGAFAGRPIEWAAKAMTDTLGTDVYPTDEPTAESPLLGPSPPALYTDDTPHARALRATMLVFPHWLLLHHDVTDRVITALLRVQGSALYATC